MVAGYPKTIAEFVAKWSGARLKERSAAQSHFNDLCAALGVPSATEADPHGTFYAFERGAEKTGADTAGGAAADGCGGRRRHGLYRLP